MRFVKSNDNIKFSAKVSKVLCDINAIKCKSGIFVFLSFAFLAVLLQDYL